MKHSISNSASCSPDINPEAGAAVSDPKRLAEYSANARAMAIADASKRIYSVIIEVLSAEKSKKK